MDAGKENILLPEKNCARIIFYCLWLVHSSGAIHFTSEKYNPSRSEPKFVNILRSPGIDSQPDEPVRQLFWRTSQPGYIRLTKSIPWNRFMDSGEIDSLESIPESKLHIVRTGEQGSRRFGTPRTPNSAVFPTRWGKGQISQEFFNWFLG